MEPPACCTTHWRIHSHETLWLALHSRTQNTVYGTCAGMHPDQEADLADTQFSALQRLQLLVSPVTADMLGVCHRAPDFCMFRKTDKLDNARRHKPDHTSACHLMQTISCKPSHANHLMQTMF